MGRELAERFPLVAQTFAEADDALGFPLSKLCFEGPEEDLRLTENTQPAILTVSIAVARVLAEHGVEPALAAAIRWASGRARGRRHAQLCRCRSLCKSARKSHAIGCSGRAGAMAAVLSLDPATVIEICKQAAAETGLTVQAANLNSPGQTVISGALAAVEKASALAKAKGARRAVMLPVSAPFHCALMQPAQEEVARVLARCRWLIPASR